MDDILEPHALKKNIVYLGCLKHIVFVKMKIKFAKMQKNE